MYLLSEEEDSSTTGTWQSVLGFLALVCQHTKMKNDLNLGTRGGRELHRAFPKHDLEPEVFLRLGLQFYSFWTICTYRGVTSKHLERSNFKVTPI